MSIIVEHLNTSLTTHSTHLIHLYNEIIYTTVTHAPSIVNDLISDILYIHRFRLHRLFVGLDIEWRPNFGHRYNNPVATLQLCIGRRCLVFQILHASAIPKSLSDFLTNSTYQFVGVGIKGDVHKLMADCNLWVENTTDLRSLAVEELQRNDFRHVGLKGLARKVLGMEIEKPRNVTLSRWDADFLDDCKGYFPLHKLGFEDIEKTRVLGLGIWTEFPQRELPTYLSKEYWMRIKSRT